MAYTLAAAAAATGLNKRTILRAIKSGQIAGTKDESGEWQVEPAELHRAFPPVSGGDNIATAPAQHDAPDIEALGAQIESLLRQAGERLRQQIDEARRAREDGCDPSPQLAFADDQHER
jgi:hypothetical protein